MAPTCDVSGCGSSMECLWYPVTRHFFPWRHDVWPLAVHPGCGDAKPDHQQSEDLTTEIKKITGWWFQPL